MAWKWCELASFYFSSRQWRDGAKSGASAQHCYCLPKYKFCEGLRGQIIRIKKNDPVGNFCNERVNHLEPHD